ncbi:LacI family DNA-binding transcriptional regulator [Streptosporangium amethystogenes]|uniref:LacI family DNA-binding transcriptional regulator n=1 Tax=Streptosporangium amethystogenes TaxID=2002 RepID=UPI0004C8A4E7|nr:GntR family transcriptional regulator [Streptosporangium amethystogenes]
MNEMADSQEPLYQQVKRDLVAAISRGDYVPDQPFVSQREVCERFGVSTTTAVRALNELVAEGYLVRQRGRGTFVAERPSEPARSRERSIAYIMHGSGPHNSDIIEGIESVCAELGYRMFLSNTKGSMELQERALRQALDAQAGGVALYSVDGRAESPALAELKRRGVPVVMVDRYNPEFPTDAVLFDNYSVGYRLTDYLVRQGHRRITALWDATDCTSVQERLTGHVQALREHGIPISPELTALTTYLRLPDQRRLDMLAALLDRPEPPTALLCANGYVLAHAARNLTALGVEVPGQIELAGMDDAGPFDLLPLTIAAAHLPSKEMGRRAMRMLAERIDQPETPREVQHVVLPIEIRTRESASAYLRVVAG